MPFTYGEELNNKILKLLDSHPDGLRASDFAYLIDINIATANKYLLKLQIAGKVSPSVLKNRQNKPVTVWKLIE